MTSPAPPTHNWENFVWAIQHPVQFRTIAQWTIFHDPKRDITSPTDYESTRYNEPTMRTCWDLLDSTAGPYYAEVVKDLESDLARVICIAYLVFRALDIIEGDSTLTHKVKETTLRQFSQNLTKPGWKFDCGPQVKGNQVLAEFASVIAELALLKAECRTTIINAAKTMGSGMADFIHRAGTAARTSGKSFAVARNKNVTEMDLYCHYTAGLVGEAISTLFVSLPAPATRASAVTETKTRAAMATIERPWLAEQTILSNSYGLLVKKATLIRDVLEDVKGGAWLWPEEVVRRGGFKSMEALVASGKGQEAESADQAMWVLSEMIVNALGHVVNSLDYLVLLRNQSVFNFVALPAVMAIANLELCFMNPQVFEGEVEVLKADTITYMKRSTDPYTVAYIVMELARKIHAKASPRDPHFLAVSVMCGKIIAWVEHHYPTYITFTKETRTVIYDETDPRSRVVKRDQEMDQEKQRLERQAKRDADMKIWLEKQGVKPAEGGAEQKGDVRPHVADGAPWQLYFFLIGLMVLMFAVGGAIIVGVLWYFYGEEFNWQPAEEGQGAMAIISKLLGIYKAPGGGDPLVVQR